jgi:hypothetical protein
MLLLILVIGVFPNLVFSVTDQAVQVQLLSLSGGG